MGKQSKIPTQIMQVVQQTNLDIAQTKIKSIALKYSPYMQQVNDIADIVATLKKGNEAHVETAKRARIDLGKICSAVEQRKKEDKASLLLEANYYQALFNTVNGAARIVQDEAKQIEKHAEIQAAKKIAQLQQQRISQVTKYGVDGQFIDVGSMSEEVWQNFLLGTKTAWKQKQQAEQKAKQDEILRAKKEQQQRRALELKLQKQQEQAQLNYEKTKKLEAVGLEMGLNEVAALSEAAYKKLYDNSKSAFDKRVQNEQKNLQKRSKVLKQHGFQQEERGFVHVEANFRLLPNSIKKMQDEEFEQAIRDFKQAHKAQILLKQQAQLEEQQRKAQALPDKAKLEDFISTLISTPSPQLKTKQAQKIMEDINTMLIKMENYVNDQIKKM